MYRVNVVKLDKNLKPLSNEVLEELTFESISAYVEACYAGTMNEKMNRKYGVKNWTYCDYIETPYGTSNLK